MSPSFVYAQAGPTSCATSTVDITEYVAPRCEGGNPCSINASSISKADRHVGNVQNSIEWVDGNRFKQNSNEIHFLYEVTGSTINFLQDTIWDPFVCTNGQDAMYRVYDGASSNWGAQLLDRQMSCGVPHVYQARIQPLEYNPQVETQVDMPLNQCVVNGQGTQVTTNTNELFFQGLAECNGHKNLDIIGIRNTGGAGAGEVYFYCKGYGLCAWYQELNFAAPGNNPRTWKASTDVCDLKPGVADYYLYPVAGLEKVYTYNTTGQVVPQNEVAPISNEIFSDLVDQGYQAYCTTPTFNIKGGQEGDIQAFREVFANNPNAGVFDITSQLTAATDKATYPLFRNSTDLPTLMSSLEQYWGYQEIEQDITPEEKSLRSAPIYKLLTIEEQCEQKVSILRSIRSMCEKLEVPDSCALYRPVPGYPNSSTRTLLDQFTATGLSCEDVGNNEVPETARGAVDALMNTPLYLDKAYRLAFLVISVPLQEYQPAVYFNFLRVPTPEAIFEQGSAKPANEVRVLAFRIPDIGTNKNPQDSGFYQDPLQLTNSVLSTPEQIAARYETQAQAKAALKSGGDAGRVQCSLLPSELASQTACQDPLSKAVIDLVNKQPEVTGPYDENGLPLPCGDASVDTLLSEEARAIGDEASLGSGGETTLAAETESLTQEELAAQEAATVGLNFKPGFELLKSLFSIVTGQTNEPESTEFNFISRLDLHKDGGTESKVQMYLVYPVGYELKDVEARLASLIMTPEELAEYHSDPDLERYFEMSGVAVDFTSDEQSIEFPYGGAPSSECINQIAATAQAEGIPEISVNTANIPACANLRKATAKVIDEQYERQPRVLGGVLGHLMRTLQLSLHTTGSAIHTYIASCKTTEDFLRGNCSGDPTAQGVDSGTGDGAKTCLNVREDSSALATYAQQLKSNLAGQASLWDAYYAGYLRGAPQHLFGTCVGVTPCYNHIIDQAVANNLNPYLVIAIALNETGGFKSNNADQSGPHFGCGVDRERPGFISSGPIENKLNCMLGFFRDNASLSSDAALSKYGYANGARNQNLNKIVGILSNNSYQGTCSE